MNEVIVLSWNISLATSKFLKLFKIIAHTNAICTHCSDNGPHTFLTRIDTTATAHLCQMKTAWALSQKSSCQKSFTPNIDNSTHLVLFLLSNSSF